MNIEKHEFFVVSRGFALNMDAFITLGEMISDSPPKDKKQQYDRSHEGNIYLALEVCGPVIAAKRIKDKYEGLSLDKTGLVLSLNTNDIEVWPVTEEYVKSMGVNVDKLRDEFPFHKMAEE